MAARHALHREEDNEKSRQGRLMHLEEDGERVRRWNAANPEKRKVIARRYDEKMKGKPRAWDIAHPGANAARSVAWKLKHPKARAVWGAEHPTEQRKQRLKSDQKRCALGFEPINRPFPGCEGHHLDHDRVLYIPKPLHKSVKHNIWTGRNMEQINELALAWLEQTKEVV